MEDVKMKLTKKQMLIVWKAVRMAGFGNAYYEFNNGMEVPDPITSSNAVSESDFDFLVDLAERLAKALDMKEDV
jgi:hypothetical protein